MSLKKIFLKNKFTYKIYLYYNLYIRHKSFINRKQYSQWGEDLFIEDYFKNKNKGTYLDIGCFHPFMYSNTCLLHKKGWSGVNIDINQTSIEINEPFRVSKQPGGIPEFFDDGSSSDFLWDNHLDLSAGQAAFYNHKWSSNEIWVNTRDKGSDNWLGMIKYGILESTFEWNFEFYTESDILKLNNNQYRKID